MNDNSVPPPIGVPTSKSPPVWQDITAGLCVTIVTGYIPAIGFLCDAAFFNNGRLFLLSMVPLVLLAVVSLRIAQRKPRFQTASIATTAFSIVWCYCFYPWYHRIVHQEVDWTHSSYLGNDSTLLVVGMVLSLPFALLGYLRFRYWFLEILGCLTSNPFRLSSPSSLE